LKSVLSSIWTTAKAGDHLHGAFNKQVFLDLYRPVYGIEEAKSKKDRGLGRCLESDFGKLKVVNASSAPATCWCGNGEMGGRPISMGAEHDLDPARQDRRLRPRPILADTRSFARNEKSSGGCVRHTTA